MLMNVFVKSQATKQILLQGNLRDDLYIFPTFLPQNNLRLITLLYLLLVILTSYGILAFVTLLLLLFGM